MLTSKINGDGKVTLEEFLEYSNNDYISGVLLEINEMLEETTTTFWASMARHIELVKINYD